MTRTKKVPANEQVESCIDAVRRHLCQILGFDLALIEFVNGDELITVASVAADSKGKAGELLNNLTDENEQFIASANTDLAQEIKHSKEALVTRAFNRDKQKKNAEAAADKNLGYPYAIIPISITGSQISRF